jgi:hypothetical protein
VISRPLKSLSGLLGIDPFPERVESGKPLRSLPIHVLRGRPLIHQFALIFGIIYLVVGVLGFLPGLVQPAPDAPPVAADAIHGRLLGLFTINIVHVLIGAWGVLGWRSSSGAILFSRGVAIFYGLLAILGLIPVTNTLFGLVPIHDHDVWLHAVSALIAAYFGFIAPGTAGQQSGANTSGV